MFQRLFCIGFFLCIANFAIAQYIIEAKYIHTTADSIAVLIGDQFQIKVKASIPKGASIHDDLVKAYYELEENPVDLIRQTEWDTTAQTSSSLIVEKFLTLGGFMPTVAPLSFPYLVVQNDVKLEGESNELKVTVDIVQPPDTLNPIKPILEEETSLADFTNYFLALGLFLLLGIGVLVFFLRKKKEEVVEEVHIPIPAHELALDKLSMLKQAQLWQQGKVKEYQSQLTYIVREYIEKSFNVQALESTSREIIQGLGDTNVEAAQKEKLKEMFTMADMVKFAKAKPPVDANEKLMDFAEGFVQETQKNTRKEAEVEALLTQAEMRGEARSEAAAVAAEAFRKNVKGEELPETTSTISLKKAVALKEPEKPESKPLLSKNPFLAKRLSSKVPPPPTPTEFAPVWKRMVAHFLDSFILSIICLVLVFITSLFFDSIADAAILLLAMPIIMIVTFVTYFTVLESRNRATFGKAIMEIEVVTEQEETISVGKALLRVVLKLVGALFFLIPFLVAFVTEKKQALHDIAANTIVINKKY